MNNKRAQILSSQQLWTAALNSPHDLSQIREIATLRQGDLYVINIYYNKLRWILQMIQGENCQLNSDSNLPSDGETAPPPHPEADCQSHHIMCDLWACAAEKFALIQKKKKHVFHKFCTKEYFTALPFG